MATIVDAEKRQDRLRGCLNAVRNALRIIAAGSILPLLIVTGWLFVGADPGSWLLFPWWIVKKIMPGTDVSFLHLGVSRIEQILVDGVSGFVMWWGLLHMSLRGGWSQALKERIEKEAYIFIHDNKTLFEHPDEFTTKVNIATATEWIPRRAEDILTERYSVLTQPRLLAELYDARIGPVLICIVASAMLFALLGFFLSLVQLAVGLLLVTFGFKMDDMPVLFMLIPAVLVGATIIIGASGKSGLGYGSFKVSDCAIRDAVMQAGCRK